MKLKRYATKYVRDRAKSRYKKDSACTICGSDTELDFHHFKTVSILVHNFMAEKGYEEEDVLKWRDEFISTHEKELYEEAVTLCHAHHEKLHQIYGRNPDLYTAAKQERWVKRQREKHGCMGDN